jgi:hypothetical protein
VRSLFLFIHGIQAVFARPLFSINESRVIGSGLAFGIVESNVKLF